MWHPSGDPRNNDDKTVEQQFFKNADEGQGDNADFTWRSKMQQSMQHHKQSWAGPVPLPNDHQYDALGKVLQRSDALDYVNKQPIVFSNEETVRCKGTARSGIGHPQVFIQLNTKTPWNPISCKYCGTKYMWHPKFWEADLKFEFTQDENVENWENWRNDPVPYFRQNVEEDADVEKQKLMYKVKDGYYADKIEEIIKDKKLEKARDGAFNGNTE